MSTLRGECGPRAVQAFVEDAHQAGAVLDAARGALEWDGQAAFGFAEDDFGEGAAAVALGQCGGETPDVGGDRAGVAGELEGDLLVVAGREVRVLPREDGGDEGLVRGAVQGQFGVQQALGIWSTA
ncbi:hypothetical protein I6J42_34595 (plasmid) [Streptomyces californicus]|uniref:Uncharacterized protein n=1 Tax=Streptomyces californicus TaxID=67351 RepID=A0ABD7D6U9_9ACTN|nr:hypothetical protein I6J39_34235 [Streptomyces californicus]QRV39204.1 hypothetical protein I6J42_34595 [Streptomyces californicus]QRV45842.1 hypothetical protein I6J41_34160 [Streptomyces californicus]QRV52657.1 hypothetical protein I6J43_34615 [Streptomyces californicus]